MPSFMRARPQALDVSFEVNPSRRILFALAGSYLLSQAGCTSGPQAYGPQPGVQGPPSPLAEDQGPLIVQSSARSLNGYKHDVAQHIYQKCPELLFDGAPPPMLRAVIVLSLSVASDGRPLSVGVVRSNGYDELEAIAVKSVRRAAPLPLPDRSVIRANRVDFYETWLFRNDGRFQIRSLAEAQPMEAG
jgi:protein TonB